MSYVDGFVLPIPTKNLAAYRKMSRKAGKLWMEYGALEYHECAGDDLKIKGVLSFTKMAACKRGETVVFAWIVYKTKAHRDRVIKKVMADPRINEMCGKDVPFDFKRMAMGGFKSIVDFPKS